MFFMDGTQKKWNCRGKLKILGTWAYNVFSHNYSMMQIKKKKLTIGKFWGYPDLHP
jgi:hypothetical protein